MDCTMNVSKIALQVNSIVCVTGNHFGDYRTEPYYGVVICLILYEQAKMKWSIFLTTNLKIEMLK